VLKYARHVPGHQEAERFKEKRGVEKGGRSQRTEDTSCARDTDVREDPKKSFCK